ncbi:unnamed protein product, partial [Mesorhabditis spiculigera]
MAATETMTDEQKANLEALRLKLEAEQRSRRSVYEAIISLMDTVDEATLQKQANLLHIESWDEVVEERYLSKVCGWPTCPNEITPGRKFQKYHIDRKAKKVYEVCPERAKYCGSICFDRSVALKAQLPAESLWLTGSRKEIIFDLSVPEKPSMNIKPLPDSVEFVADKVLAQLSDLRIAENAAETDSDDEEETTFSGEPIEKCNKEDLDFIASIKNFVSSKAGDSKEEVKKTPERKSPAKHPLNKETDAEKLARLRAKHGTNKQPIRKSIPFIEPTALPVIHKGEKTISAAGKVEKQVKKANMKAVCALIREWLGHRTRELVRVGGARPFSEVDAIFKRFYAGDMADREDLFDSIYLPSVASLDAHRMRCDMLFPLLRKTWDRMEDRIASPRKHIDELAALVRSMNLTAENVLGFRAEDVHAIVIVLFRVVCYLCPPSEEQHFFPANQPPTAPIQKHLQKIGVDFDEYCAFLKELEAAFSFE